MIPRKKLRGFSADRLASAPTVHGLDWDDNLTTIPEARAELRRRIREDSPRRAREAREALDWLNKVST